MQKKKGLLEKIPYIHRELAEKYITDLTPKLKLTVARTISKKQFGRILLEMDEEQKKKLLAELKDIEICQVASFMKSDDATDLIKSLENGRAKRILKLLGQEKAKEIKTLLGFSEETAGSLMQTEFVWVKPNDTASEAIEKIRVSNAGEELHNVFVLNSKRVVIGVLPLRRLFLAKPSAKISKIMSRDVFSVPADTDQEKVAKKFREKDLISMSVVDSQDRMLGIITVDDVIDVLEEEATEDIYRLAGLNEEESVFSSPFFSIRKRAPWLTINLFTAVLAAFSIALFENLLLAMATIAVYLPIVAGMGGNAGTQTLAIMVRGLALGEVSIKEYKRVLKKELTAGFVNGLITGVVVMTIVFLWKGTLIIGFILLAAMVINLLVAAASGTLVPLLLKWKKIDPALASSIIITTFTDVCGFIAFLGIATLFWKAGLLA